jgi:hypothetical protein
MDYVIYRLSPRTVLVLRVYIYYKPYLVFMWIKYINNYYYSVIGKADFVFL